MQHLNANSNSCVFIENVMIIAHLINEIAFKFANFLMGTFSLAMGVAVLFRLIGHDAMMIATVSKHCN